MWCSGSFWAFLSDRREEDCAPLVVWSWSFYVHCGLFGLDTVLLLRSIVVCNGFQWHRVEYSCCPLWKSFSELDSKSMEFEGVLNKTFGERILPRELLALLYILYNNANILYCCDSWLKVIIWTVIEMYLALERLFRLFTFGTSFDHCTPCINMLLNESLVTTCNWSSVPRSICKLQVCHWNKWTKTTMKLLTKENDGRQDAL